jgi:hypothetical protein
MPSKPRSLAGAGQRRRVDRRVAEDEIVRVTLHDQDGALLFEGDVREQSGRPASPRERIAVLSDIRENRRAAGAPPFAMIGDQAFGVGGLAGAWGTVGFCGVGVVGLEVGGCAGTSWLAFEGAAGAGFFAGSEGVVELVMGGQCSRRRLAVSSGQAASLAAVPTARGFSPRGC